MKTLTICDYGCGQEAKYTFKTGKCCCSKSVNSCPSMKLKNSNGLKIARERKGSEYWSNGQHPQTGKKSIPWNKGLSKETDERVLKHSEKVSITVKKAYDEGKLTGKANTFEKEIIRCNKLSLVAKEKCLGGYVEGSGRGKSGRYKGYWCDSSWELAYVIYNLDHDINFSRNTEKFTYIHNGNEYKYIPDFKENDIYIEIKGYNTPQWQSKLTQFNKPIKVLYKEDIKKYLDYVVSKYGKDFINLY